MAEINQYFPPIVYHPGETLKEKLEELGMGSKEFAIRSGKPEKTISAVLNGKSSLTPDMAVQFEKVLSIPAHFWLNRQCSYDEYIAREKAKVTISNAMDWARKFPLPEMRKMRWIAASRSLEDNTSALLSFFGFSNHVAWRRYYISQSLKWEFRISLASSKDPYAISAWLRQGELTANALEAIPFSKKLFKKTLEKIKALMAEQPEDFFLQLQALCLNAGVKVVHTPCLPKAPINGATRWLNETPLIQLSGRHKRNDIFWFTFFHEAGHILLHGSKEIFVDEEDSSKTIDIKEEQADEFAAKWVFSNEQEAEMLRQPHLTAEDILRYAQKYGTHPGIIIGRLHHKKLVPYSMGQQFITKIHML